MRTIKLMPFVIALFLSATISINTTQAQQKQSSTHRYPYTAKAFTKVGIPAQSYFISGYITPDFGKDPKGLIKKDYLYSMPDKCVACKTHYTIGRWVTAVYAGVVRHMYPVDPGFENSFQTTEIPEMASMVLSSSRLVQITPEAFTPEEWERSWWICDEIVKKDNPTTWYDSLGTRWTEYKVKDFEGLTIMFFNCQPAFVMENGAIIAPNNPAKFDFQKFSLTPDNEEWGYKDTVIEKLAISSSAFGSSSDTPIPKPQKPDPKAPQMCPPVVLDPAAKKLKEVEEELTGAKNDLGNANTKISDLQGQLSETTSNFEKKLADTREELLAVTGELGDAIDQVLKQSQEIGDLKNSQAQMASDAALNKALAQQHLDNVKAELAAAEANNKSTKEEVASLKGDLENAKSLIAKVDGQNQELLQSNEGLKYQIKNQEAVFTAEINKYKQHADSITKAQTVEIENVKNRVTKVEEKVDKVTARVDVLEKNDKKQDTDIAGLKKTTEAHTKRLDDNDAKNKSQDEEIALGKEETRKQKEALSALDIKTSAGLKNANDKIDGVTVQVNALKNEVANVNKKAEEAAREAQRAKEDAAEAKAKALALEREMEENKKLQAKIDSEQDRRNAEGINKAQMSADQANAKAASLENKITEQQYQQKAAAANTTTYTGTPGAGAVKTTATTTQVTSPFDAMSNSKKKDKVKIRVPNYKIVKGETTYDDEIIVDEENCPECPPGFVKRSKATKVK